MEQSDASGFSFGEAVETEYIEYQIVDTQFKLPYNPFQFDLKLAVFKSKPNYEEPGTEFCLSRDKKTIFCRKKKTQKEWIDETSTPKYLNAQIISEKHFSIDEKYFVRDENSKHGTYFWVSRLNPLKIVVNDTYLIAREPLVISKVVHLPKPMIELKYKDRTIKIAQSKKLFLIGSHQKCDLIIPQLYKFQICINVSSFKIFTYLEEEQASAEHGLWYKIKNDINGKVKVENGSLLLVEPYIFKATS